MVSRSILGDEERIGLEVLSRGRDRNMKQNVWWVICMFPIVGSFVLAATVHIWFFAGMFVFTLVWNIGNIHWKWPIPSPWSDI